MPALWLAWMAICRYVYGVVLLFHASPPLTFALLSPCCTQALRKVVYGTGLLTPQIQATAAALLANRIPNSWEASWEGPEAPKAWIHAVLARRIALSRWASEATSGRLLDGPLNLSELYAPGTFLNALRQQTARLAGEPIDRLKLSTSFDAGLLREAPLAVSLKGLLLQGSSFDRERLGACNPDASELVPLPSVTVAWVPAKAAEPYPAHASIKVPLYFSPQREKLLTQICMPCGNGEQDVWVLAGVAAFLSAEV